MPGSTSARVSMKGDVDASQEGTSGEKNPERV
jgi:hypothetical protein